MTRRLMVWAVALMTGFLPARAEERLLRFAFPEGRACALSVEMKQDLVQSFGPQKTATRQEMRLDYALKGMPPDPSGNAVVRVTISRIALSIDSEFAKISFDTERPETLKAAANDPMSAGFAALAGGTFTMTMSARGEVLAVAGAEAIAEKAVKAIPEGPVREMLAGQFRAMYGDAAMRDQMGQFLPVYPEGPVKPGDRWTRKGSVRMGPVAIDQESGYTVAGLRPDGADLAVEAVFASPDAADPAADMTIRIRKGTQKGTLSVDAGGVLTASDARQSMECDIVAQGMAMGQTMEAVLVVRRIDAEKGTGEKR